VALLSAVYAINLNFIVRIMLRIVKYRVKARSRVFWKNLHVIILRR